MRSIQFRFQSSRPTNSSFSNKKSTPAESLFMLPFSITSTVVDIR
jgi:hypothetical protein